MRKVRGFRLELHAKEIRRRVKKKVDLAAMGLEEERPLQAFLDEAASRIQAAVLFDSYGADAATAELAPIPGLAHTLGLATLGPALGPWIEQAAAVDQGRARLLETAAGAALESAVQFVVGLLKEEVEAERCELSPIQHLADPAAAARVLERLGGAKIGLAAAEGGGLPPHATAFCLSWVPVRGRAKTGAARK